MSIHKPVDLPLRLHRARKTDVRTQFAALPFRMQSTAKGPKMQFCLITSRGTGRWIVPKGWPMPGVSPAEAVAREAFEEAGLEGEVLPQAIGLFSYDKVLNRTELPVIAVVYAIRVTKVLKQWPEADQRKRKWLSHKKAAARLEDRELRRILLAFDPADYGA